MQADGDTGTRPWLGLLAGLAAVTIWAGWISATRLAMTEHVDPLILAICRNGIPALLLAPVIWRRGLVPRGANPGALALMTLGWGAPFVFMTGMGLASVPASMFGPLVPGLAPILVAGLAWGFLGERPRRTVLVGLVLIGASLALIIGGWLAEGDAAIEGLPYLLAASIGISVFSVSLRRSGLNPVEATGYIGLWSVPLLAVWTLLRPHAFDGLTLSAFAMHAVVQGVLTGLVAVLAYGMALRHLGTVRGSTMNALVPVGAALVGVLALGEVLGPLGWAAIACASLGVAAANGALGR